MSTTPDETTDGDEPYADPVLVTGRSNGGPRPHLHVPGEDDKPLCGATLKKARENNKDWCEKPLAVYPEGWRKWCPSCVKIVEGES